MFATIKFADRKTIFISCTEFSRFLLIQNYAEDGFLEKPIVYPETFTFNDYKLITNFISNLCFVKATDIVKILNLFEYLGADTRQFGLDYIKFLNQWPHPTTIKEILIVQHLTKTNVLTPDQLPVLKLPIGMELGGYYQTLRNLKHPILQAPVVTLSDNQDVVEFPKITIPRCYPIGDDPIILKSTEKRNIKDGRIDWSETVWFADFPWKKFNIGVTGGFLISALCDNLEPNQDIDVYPLDNNVKPLIRYWSEKFDDLQALVNENYQDGIMVMTLLSKMASRPLQIICTGLTDMHDIVRTFDLSHLRIWYTYEGLMAEVTTVYELLGSFTRFVRPSRNDRKRIEKYHGRGFTVCGDKEMITEMPSQEIKMISISPLDAVEYLAAPKITLADYHQKGGYIHLGNITDLTKRDIETLRIDCEQTRFKDMCDITPVRVYVPITGIIPDAQYDKRYSIQVCELVMENLVALATKIMKTANGEFGWIRVPHAMHTGQCGGDLYRIKSKDYVDVAEREIKYEKPRFIEIEYYRVFAHYDLRIALPYLQRIL